MSRNTNPRRPLGRGRELPISSADTTPSSIYSAEDQRWSDVVPPDSALTFAAIYDPDEGLITLSGADIFPSQHADAKSIDSPSDACDQRSQVLSLDQYALSTNNTATRAYFRDAQPYRLQTQAKQTFARESSTIDGLDVYSQEANVPRGSRYWSVFSKLDKSPMFNPHTGFMGLRRSRDVIEEVQDEGFFEGAHNRQSDPHNLCSKFSMTTTSTSNYVEVEGDDGSLYSSWSTMETPAQLPPSSRLSQFPPPPRRLRKRRPDHLQHPAPPAEVLARGAYNNDDGSNTSSNNTINHPSNLLVPRPRLRSEPSTSSVTLAARSITQKFANHLEKLRHDSLNEGWVCVDVTQKITQHVVKDGKK